ncbi:HD domain-containing protein [Metaplanococcus flavidus]|uniref:HD domain-containing protein n=1 Tax=Metaplanococcus flavidus TaxID=569883 RepID=A0ABW3LAY0_9BACL
MSQLIDNAICFAAVKHHGQYRKGTNTPYFTHPFAVAMILVEEAQTEEIVVAALLHDTLEDTDATEEELFKNFGEDILMLVKAASEPDKSLSWELRKQHTIEGLPLHSIEELHLILADKLHNLRSIHADVQKQGERIWQRFNRGKRDQCWYYMGIIGALKNRKKEIPLLRKLEEEAMELFIGKKRLKLHDIQLLFNTFHSHIDKEREELMESGLDDFIAELQNAASEFASAQDETLLPVQLLLKDANLELTLAEGNGIQAYAYLQELKHRLAWSDELFLKYFRQFIAPDAFRRIAKQTNGD